MVALKGKPDIGDQINKGIIAPLASANKLSDMPDFNDATKLGGGKETCERSHLRIETHVSLPLRGAQRPVRGTGRRRHPT
jgi:hypothetical protein